MQRSLNEIETTLVKAARGSGQPIGIAEDLARAGVWLCRLGCDGVSVVLASLEATSEIDRPLVVGDQQIATGPQHPVLSALASIDFALREPGTIVRLSNGLPVPEILIGLAGQASHGFDVSFSISIGGTQKIAISTDGASEKPDQLPADKTIKILATSEMPIASA